MTNTVHPQFEADHRRWPTLPSSGTPYNSDPGNPGATVRAVYHDRYARVIDPAAGDQSDPAVNGSGTVFDGTTRAHGYSAHPAPYPDSPVLRDASTFDPSYIPAEDAAHLGESPEASVNDNLITGSGVMSRD